MRLRVPHGVLAMALVVGVSNFAVQHPLGDWLTWAAFTFPFAFLVADLANRSLDPSPARIVVYAGFACGVLLSFLLATPRIAVASGSAFLFAQLLNMAVFHRIRWGYWWRAPLVSSILGSLLDTIFFFALAFSGTDLPWITLAIGDFGAKYLFAFVMLGFYRIAMPTLSPFGGDARSGKKRGRREAKKRQQPRPSQEEDPEEPETGDEDDEGSAGGGSKSVNDEEVADNEGLQEEEEEEEDSSSWMDIFDGNGDSSPADDSPPPDLDH